MLAGKGYESYLPLYKARRIRANNIVVETPLPLFPGYVFCRFDAKRRLPILTTTGVISVVSFGKEPAPIPDEEIEAVMAVLRSGCGVEPCAFLREGQRVRVIQGSMLDLEGILVKKKNEARMVISVTMLQRSISVEIEGYRLAAA